MRVVIVGATGNVGTSLVEQLAADDRVTSVLGLARRIPSWRPGKTEWAAVDLAADTAGDDLMRYFRGADAVVHLAWLFQPTHDPVQTWRANVLGSIRVFDAVAAAEVPALVYASSVGAYSPAPSDDRPVDESWPTHGWPAAAYSSEKAYVERVLDGFERAHLSLRVVRLRPGFIFKRRSATGQRRLFAGPLLPHMLVRPELIPILPGPAGLRFQALHTDDAADAYRRAVAEPVRGPFNIAADPVVDVAALGPLLRAKTVRTPARPLRAVLAAAWRLHLVPASPDLFDAVLRLPIMDTARARTELGWTPRHGALDAVAELLDGLRAGAGMDTPPLAPDSGRGRIREVATGVGRRP